MDCSFCGNDIERGIEKIFISKKGKAFYFCSRKCEKNLLKLKRKARKVGWTKEYRKEKAIRLKGMSKEEKVKTGEEKSPKEKPEDEKIEKEKLKDEKKKSR